MDQFDKAQELDALYRRQALEAHGHGSRNQPFRTHCIECGIFIPKARRQAAPGCDRCIECKEKQEKRRRC